MEFHISREIRDRLELDDLLLSYTGNVVFANVAAVKAEARGDPEMLEISMDTKAKVALGDYSRGGKNPHQCGGGSDEGMGPRSAGDEEADAAGHSGAGDGSVDADIWLA